VPLFCGRKDYGVQSFVLKLVNNHCSDVDALRDGPRLEGRVNLTLVVLVVPIERGKPRPEKTFTALTKEFATSGISLVLVEPKAPDEVLLGFYWEGGLKYVRGKAKHLSPMGGGFYQLGVQLSQMVHVSDWPGLEKLSF